MSKPSGPHPEQPLERREDACHVCAALTSHVTVMGPTEHNCVNMCWDLVARNLKRTHNSIHGLAVKYAASLLPMLPAEERHRVCSLASACLLRPITGCNEKATRRVLYFLGRQVRHDPDKAGLIILRLRAREAANNNVIDTVSRVREEPHPRLGQQRDQPR